MDAGQGAEGVGAGGTGVSYLARDCTQARQ